MVFASALPNLSKKYAIMKQNKYRFIFWYLHETLVGLHIWDSTYFLKHWRNWSTHLGIGSMPVREEWAWFG
jgi:hypothetical protein